MKNSILALLLSHLSDGFHVVDFDDRLAYSHVVPSGLIPGSASGPHLFLPYINEISEAIHHGTPLPPVDKIKVVYCFETSALKLAHICKCGRNVHPHMA